MLPIILDIILVAILVGGIVLGIKKGFVRVVTKPLRSLVAFAIAFTTASPIGHALIAPLISKPIIDGITSFLYENYSHITAENTDELPTFIKLVAGLMNVDLSTLGANTNEIIGSVAESLTMPIVNIISALLAFVILVVLLKLLLKLVFSLIDKIFQKGVLGVLNKVLGCIVCTLIAIFVAWILVLVLDGIFHLSGGFIFNLFKQYNPVELLLSF